ncbi:hypothetical protein MANI_116202 [Metarhizium anisopliae]
MEAWDEFYKLWHHLMSSPNEHAFQERQSRFETKYLPNHLNEVGYVRSTWLDPYKGKLVKAWVDQHRHFGNTATSRVEGIHALLKSYLQKSTLDLFEAWRAMKQALLNQLSDLKSNQARQQVRVPVELSGPLYSVVRGWVSHEALRKVEEQRRLIEKNDPPPSPTCTGMFTKSHGLPCVHELMALQQNNGVLLLEHFHSHWHLQRDGEPQILLEPRQRLESRAETFQASRTPQQSTRREPSAFELVEKPRKAPSKCSKCGVIGHSRVSRACPLRFEELLNAGGGGGVESTPLPVAQTSQVVAAIPSSPMATDQHPVETAESEIGDLPGPMRSLLRDVSVSPEPVSYLQQVSKNPSPCSAEPEAEPGESQSVKPAAQELRYDSPQAIYSRYVAARNEWFSAQPAGSIKTNQQYRRAMGLPLRYDKQSYDWCLDYKQMNKKCSLPAGTRDWTKEEMMAYLDWSKAEDERVEAKVLEEIGSNPMGSTRRGVKDIWKGIEEDSRAQEAIYLVEDTIENCIVVQP